MPQGYEQRFKYGDVVSSTGISGATTWNRSGRTLRDYEAVFTYRSGRRAKALSQVGNSTALLHSGSLSDQLRRRTEYLNSFIADNIVPTTGNTKVFSTVDTGHPFASYKVQTLRSYARLHYDGGATSKLDSDVVLQAGYPYPNFSDPFGNAITDAPFPQRHTYFPWPNGFYNSSPPGLSNQIVSNSIKNAIGSGVIASANPWKPKATLAITILELLSGDVPSVLKNIQRHIFELQSLKRTAGSDWLNVQFGWVPLFQDIRNTIEVLMKLHMLLMGGDDYRRTRGGDLGTWARIADTTNSRVVAFASPLDPTNTSVPFFSRYTTGGVPQLAPPQIVGGRWSRSTRIKADFRFSARYHNGALPNSKERGFLERATETLGLEVTPAVLWELTPWTWLLDWGSNLGSIASNLSLLDWSNVLLDYAYLTFVVESTGSISVDLPSRSNGVVVYDSTHISQGFKSIEKIREQASPVGFSVSWGGLDPFQLSILAALGMSRGR
jgi:hypothetical protein